ADRLRGLPETAMYDGKFIPAVRDKAALMLWTLKFWCDELPTKDPKKDATNG
ncbi:MAG: hypothetical protein IMX04_03320, partial [Candidatus Carbobacillus altaicus]|nr:hypothetical protein [Candidatus Carbobacillus altaicus]